MDSLLTVEADVDRAKTCFSRLQSSIRKELADAISNLRSLKNSLDDGSGQVSEAKAAEIARAANHVRDLTNRLANDHRDLHAAVSRIGKTIDKNFNAGNSLPIVEWPLQSSVQKRIIQLIFDHFVRRGYLDAARTLKQEANLTQEEAQVADDVVELLETEEALRAGNLIPAIEWVEKRRALLDPDFVFPASTVPKEAPQRSTNEMDDGDKEPVSAQHSAADTSSSFSWLTSTPRATATRTPIPLDASMSSSAASVSASNISAATSFISSSSASASTLPSGAIDPIASNASTPTPTQTPTSFAPESSFSSGLMRFTSLAPAVPPMPRTAFNMLPLEFRLNRLQFLELLRAGRTRDALNYSKKMSPFANRPGCSKELQTLMAALMYVRFGAEALARSPYAYLLATPPNWSEVSDEFVSEAGRLLGLLPDSPLSTFVEVGSSALPPLLTLRNVIQQRRMSLVFSGNELPVRPTSAYDNEY